MILRSYAKNVTRHDIEMYNVAGNIGKSKYLMHAETLPPVRDNSRKKVGSIKCIDRDNVKSENILGTKRQKIISAIS